MKKIFTLFAAMMLFVGGAFAERITLWESETPEGTLVEWGKQLAQQAAGQNLNVGDKLILTVVKFDTEIDAYPQVGFKGTNWENVGSFDIVKDKEMPYEATFTLSASDVEALSAGFWISGAAAWVTKLEYEASETTEDLSHAIWIGEKVFDGWGVNIEVKKDVFVDTKVGDEIRCYYKDRKDDFNLVPKTNGWIDIKDGDTKVEKDGYVSLIVTENMLLDLQATGFAIQGVGFTLTHIDLLSATPEEPKTSETIWEGESIFGNWANGFSVAADKFASAKAGDAIEFVYTTDTEGDGTTKPTWWQIKTIYADTETTLEGNASDLNEWGCATVSSGSTSYKITLTETDVANLKEKGLFANGYFLVVTKANLIQTTGINAIEAAKPVQNDIMYNLAGQKVGAGYKGIVIKNGKKVIVK